MRSLAPSLHQGPVPATSSAGLAPACPFTPLVSPCALLSITLLAAAAGPQMRGSVLTAPAPASAQVRLCGRRRALLLLSGGSCWSAGRGVGVNEWRMCGGAAAVAPPTRRLLTPLRRPAADAGAACDREWRPCPGAPPAAGLPRRRPRACGVGERRHHPRRQAAGARQRRRQRQRRQRQQPQRQRRGGRGPAAHGADAGRGRPAALCARPIGRLLEAPVWACYH